MITKYIFLKELSWQEDNRIRRHLLKGDYANAARLKNYYAKRDIHFNKEKTA